MFSNSKRNIERLTRGGREEKSYGRSDVSARNA